MVESKKSLICITSCNRLSYVKSLISDYLHFINDNDSFDFLLALDGTDLEYASFCDEYDIPLLFSQEREGVGITKNRVYVAFPDYDNYFFIEDDVELLDSSVFAKVVDVAERTNIHHFSLGEDFRFFGDRVEQIFEDFTIIHSNFGSGVFNFFTKHGLAQVGGWHDDFAKYKRYGHTEHSMRFPRNKLAPAPFNVIKDFINGYFLWHNPESVTLNDSVSLTSNLIAPPEVKIINKELFSYPFKVISKVTFNGNDMSSNKQIERLNCELADFRVSFYRNVLKKYFEDHNHKVHTLTGIIDDIQSSVSFTIGKKITRPFMFLKRFL